MGAPYGSQCLEDSNSTDCLLRALVELQAAQSSDYNWDPITFAFTTVISAVALVFAVTAVFQAVLASGKGRRRCSEKVIGEWSRQCKTGIRTWDWSEMNFQPTAVTPLLRTEHTGVANVYVCSLPSKSPKQELQRFKAASRESYAASWLVFFEKLGLNKYSVEGWKDSKRSIAANYLPDDLVAAPAYAQVGAVVVAAVMAGARKLDVDEQQYPNLFGPDFQVDFRQHPGLGVVGAYSQYGGFKKQSKPLLIPPLDLVDRQNQFVTSIVKYGPGFVDMHFNWKIRPEQMLGIWYNYNWQGLSPHPKPSFNYFSLEMTAVSEDHLPLLVGLLANTPEDVPVVFPTATMRTSCHHYLTAFALNSWYFAHAPFSRPSPPTVKLLDWFEGFDVPNWEGFSWSDDIELPTNEAAPDGLDEVGEVWIHEYFTKVLRPQAFTRAIPRSHRGYRVILNMCFRLIQEPAKLKRWLFDKSPEVQDVFRNLILTQLREVDVWLWEKCHGAEAGHHSLDKRACAVMLFNTTIILLHMENILKEESLKSTGPASIPQGSRRSAVAGMEPMGSRYGATTASEIYSDTLRACKDFLHSRMSNPKLLLKDMIDDMRKDPRAKHLVDIVQFEHGPRQTLLWERLSALVHRHEKDASTWPRGTYNGDEKNFRDFEDVVVFRCLLMILLFWTATDTTMLLPLMNSGIWDKIVPMI